uniref:Beta-galactoside alpha-2,6-sialyltransferase 2 n=1 Tax=Ornithorhynchus anatinus TaxID=9258 RepID=A0A6I8NQB0_ORNAN
MAFSGICSDQPFQRRWCPAVPNAPQNRCRGASPGPAMKPNLKQWKQLMLFGIFAWGLLFLAIFIYFADSNPTAPVPSTFYVEPRRLLPVQGKQRAIMGAVPEPAFPEGEARSETRCESLLCADLPDSLWPEPEDAGDIEEEFFSPQVQRGRESPRAHDPALGDSSFTADRPGPRGLARRGASLVSAGEQGLFRSGRVPRKRIKKRRSKRGRSRPPEEADEWERLYSSAMSRSFLYRLWKGNVSSRMLNPRLQKAMKDYLSINKHGVRFQGPRNGRLTGEQLLCQLRDRVHVRTLDGKEAPFSALGWDKHVPRTPLAKLYPRGFGSCAVVMSAGAILNSSLGAEIDAHDAVLRFNSAPTRGYEKDVGNKTSLRIINSQWYKKPDYNLFTPYVQHRRRYPSQPFYILHPKFIWQLWDIIQENTREKIQPNPPSSGFIGILIMMSMCREVHVYEYIPSVRQTDLCHYHELYYDAACTLGAYHPLLYEKLLVQRMNRGERDDLYRKGKVILPGFRALRCPAPDHLPHS